MADPNFRLKKGTFIDQQVGFVDAFNYMYENVNGLDGGQGVELDKSIDGAWQINADQNTGGGAGGNPNDPCKDCQELDGQGFKVSEMKPGENAAPLHPGCHCSVASYFRN